MKLQKISTGSISVMSAEICTHTHILRFSYCQRKKENETLDHTLTKGYTKETSGMKSKRSH